MEQVINILGVDMDPDKLSDAITVSNATDTRILSISVKNENPKLAKRAGWIQFVRLQVYRLKILPMQIPSIQ
ncbi:MAG: hypothetical protein ACLRMN_02460 [Mediterraneibacter gnavus]